MIIDLKDIKESKLKKAIKEGDVIIFPSDGVYMIGCSTKYSDSVDKISEIGKGMMIPASKQWITKNFKSKKNYVNKIPGPFVYVFQVKKKSKLKTDFWIAIPSHKITKKIQKAGEIIYAVPLGIRNLRSLNRKVKNMADLIIDDGFLEGQSFAIIDLREKVARIVR